MNQNNDTATSQNDDGIFDNDDDDDDDDDNGETVLSKAHIKIADTSCVSYRKVFV